MRLFCSASTIALVLFLLCREGWTETYPILAEGERSSDKRVTEIKTYQTPQSFAAPLMFGDWKERKEKLSRKILVSCGLYPVPEKSPLQAEVFDRKEYDGYTVEKVLLRTFPGYYATGNLYRPVQEDENRVHKFPGILCPHGHWGQGRLEDTDRASVPKRAASFARQGYVCFTYDMVGYMDNGKLIDHNVGGDRERIWGISPAGFQLWTGIRGVDFLESLPDVDKDRIGCTGASGGGTQTFLLTAVDDRIKVSAPVNMISSTMQGGCVCENAPGLRLDSNNMEIGALAAPRPLCLISASGDWTKLTPTVEYPAIRSVFMRYGVPQRVMEHQEDTGHNYNLASRQVVYQWFHKWFYPLRASEEFVEADDFVAPASPELAIFPDHPVPEDALPKEELFASLREYFEAQTQAALDGGVEEFDTSYGVAYFETLAVKEPDVEDIKIKHGRLRELPGVSDFNLLYLETFLLCNEQTGQEIPAHLWIPSETDVANATDEIHHPVLLIHPEGKAAVLEENGAPGEKLNRYLRNGNPVLAIDCLKWGEFIKDASSEARDDKEGHFTTYNLSNAAGRIQDILLGETYLRKRFHEKAEIVGLPGAGGEVLLAHGLAVGSASTSADLSGLNFADDAVFLDRLYIPLVRRAGDFMTSIVLGSKRPLNVIGCEDKTMQTRIDKALAAASKQ